MTRPDRAPDLEEPPPILGSWRALYIVLVIELVVLTVAGYVLGRWAA
ncbi:MAG TPA: hypothetical protein VFN67_30000 [Polyangiales bacterium]|nr:hypothetical protein [Polyangiales bacterium]